MAVESLLKNIEVVSPSIDYWFVRTDSGQNYEAFRDHNFIGIGWNYITLEDINRKTLKEVIEKIAKREGICINPLFVGQFFKGS